MPRYRRDHRAMRSKFRYLSNFTTASPSFHCDTNANQTNQFFRNKHTNKLQKTATKHPLGPIAGVTKFNTVRERCKLLQRGSGAEPQLKSNFVHFSLKICHLVATISIIFIHNMHDKALTRHPMGGSLQF